MSPPPNPLPTPWRGGVATVPSGKSPSPRSGEGDLGGGDNRLIRLLICLLITFGAHLTPPPDLPCDNWALHTRTLPTICPEVLVDNLNAPGMASMWGIAFDGANNLYFTRPATGQALRMDYRAGRFDTPRVFADQLDFPTGIACVGDTCYAATDGALVRLPDRAIQQNYPADGLPHAVHVAADGVTLRLAAPGERDFDHSLTGALWYSTERGVQSETQSVALTPGGEPLGIAFYHGAAFPQFQNGLLIVTSGSWNALTLAGYELLFVPFGAGGTPGSVTRLIPANTGRSSADAALVALSFYPYHPVAVAVDGNGWIYVSLREGRIVRLRPRQSSTP